MEICNKKNCIGCLNCYNSCKNSAISIQNDELGFKYPVIDEKKCINCNLCKKKCPILNKIQNNIINETYACKNKNNDIRKKSSSGGIFYLLSKLIIMQNGIVYGASYFNNNVIHKRIDNANDITLLMGSKYVQSDILNTFSMVKKDLDLKKYVLFSGTPCQIAALKVYLNKDYDNLYLQDIICHGVGSPIILKKHLQELGINVENNINFRNKTNGWRNFGLSIDEKYLMSKDKDNFLKIFLKNLCLRESCYDCKFKGNNRLSDITLGDFWGIEKINKNFFDDNGVSAVIINTEKGKYLFDSIKNKIKFINVFYKDISNNNICLENSSIYNSHRSAFIDDIKNNTKLSDLNNEYYNR